MMLNSSEMRAHIDAWFDAHSKELVNDVSRLIAIKSVAGEAVPGKPYGEGPAAALAEAAELLREKGFEVSDFDNHLITTDLNNQQPELGILAHLDVVSTGEGWNSNPFKAVVQNGKIIGRGAIDNKGPAVAAVYALCAVRELAPALKKGCRLILGSAEETGHDDLSYYRKTNKMPPLVFTPDSNYPVVNLEKGRLVLTFGAAWEENTALPRVVSIKGGETTNIVPNYAEAVVEGLPLAYLQARCFELSVKTDTDISAAAFYDAIKITSKGKAAHAMMPAQGKNAQTALLFVLSTLPLAESGSSKCIKALYKLFPYFDTKGKALGIAMSDEISGELTVNFGVLSLNLTGLTANFDCRTPKSATSETLDNIAVESLNTSGFQITDIIKTPCHYTPEESPFVQTLLRVYETYTGNKGACLAFGGQTYVHDIEGGVAFGPAMAGVDNHLHGANEFIAIDDLILSAKMYTQIILDLCS